MYELTRERERERGREVFKMLLEFLRFVLMNVPCFLRLEDFLFFLFLSVATDRERREVITSFDVSGSIKMKGFTYSRFRSSMRVLCSTSIYIKVFIIEYRRDLNNQKKSFIYSTIFYILSIFLCRHWLCITSW